MLAAPLSIEGFDDLWHLGEVAQSLVLEGRYRPTPPLVLLLEGGVVTLAARPGLAAVRVPADVHLVLEDPAKFPWTGPWSLGKLRRQIGAKASVAIEKATLERVFAERDARYRSGDDYVDHLLHIARALKAEVGKSVFLDPDPISHLPVPSHGALQQTADLLLPDGRAAALLVYGRRGLDAGFVIEKQRGQIVRLVGAHHLGLSPSQLAGFGDARHKPVLEAIARQVAPPHLVVFCTRDALGEILGPQPGALAAQVALRQAVIDPVPPWMMALTAAAAGAGVAQEASRLFGRFVPSSIKAQVKEAVRSASPWSTLGFDPIQLYTELRKLW